MKKTITRIIFTLFLFLNLGVKAQTGLFVPALANFDTAMVNLLSQHGIPGGQLAITYEGRLVYNRGFGYADTTTHALVQPGNTFRIASLSKPITAVTIMYLVQHGLLNLNDTVFGPNGILNQPAYQNIKDSLVYKITVKNLLCHSGGWDTNVSGDPVFSSYSIATSMGVPPPANAETVILHVLHRQMLDFRPGTQYRYSNFGFSILGKIIEKITGQSYEQYVRNTILIPLDITDMHSGFNLLSNRLPMEVNYYDYPGAPFASSVYDNTLVPGPYGGFNIEAMNSNGGWVASAADVCKFLRAVDGFSTYPDILLPATIDTMIHPSSTSHHPLGWGLDSKGNWTHRGSIPGTTTALMRGSNQINWALLLNSRPSNSGELNTAVDNLVLKVTPTITNWPPPDVSTAIKEPESASSSLRVFPNPCHGKFTIHSNSNISSLEIYNELGVRIPLANNPGEQTSSDIDISSYPKGMYFVKVGNAEKSYTRKIIIQ